MMITQVATSTSNMIRQSIHRITERSFFVDMKRETVRYSELVQGQGPIPMLQHAFNVGKTKVRECNKRYNEWSGKMERKKCGDAGKKR